MGCPGVGEAAKQLGKLAAILPHAAHASEGEAAKRIRHSKSDSRV
jgi:hypothetical protein